MRIVRAVVLLTAGLAGGESTLRGQPPDAAQVLASTREALGGEKAFASVKTFVATGRTRQIRGNNLVPIEFEISCELPDKFVRKDEIPAQDSDVTVVGFRGEELIQFPPPPPGRAGGPPGPPAGRSGPPPNPAQQRLTTVKQDFARLMLGVFAASFSPYPLTFKYAAEGEAPEGKADILDVAGPANFAVRFVVQRDTHLPVMLMWQQPATPGTAQAKPTDYRMYYAEYRTVNGIKWPFRIRRAVAGDTIEETTFDRVSVNVKIDPRKFEAPK
ncbi:MAG: hypothetical protein DMG04_28650 [Acidobacteria bacterium]|nr:MAG: hypothetical protein DMG04_28650 [Acidobacteriota bacterium]